MKTLVLYFAEFLNYDFNPAKDFALKLNQNKNLIAKEVFVTYFKNDYLKHIKKINPDKIVLLGLDENAKTAKVETLAKNKMITLKNKFYRYLTYFYVFILKLFKKNLKLKKNPKRKYLDFIHIDKSAPERVLLEKTSTLKHFKKSDDPGHFTCNFAMFTIHNYLKENNLKTRFYAIHLPLKGLTKSQEKELKNFLK